jgi:hypothetical protein
LTVRFNPVRQTGAIELRINEFNWDNQEDGITGVKGGIEDRGDDP